MQIGTPMTDATTPRRHPSRYGVWTRVPVTPQHAVVIEKLGYGALWIGGSQPAQLRFAEPILEKTTNLMVATGIVNIWSAPAKTVAQSFHLIDTAHPDRFLLGVGVGHREHTPEYCTPYDALVDYLDELDAAGVPNNRRVIAALGPRVLTLAARRSAGAHPFLTTPEHTRRARALLGDDAYLAPEQAVVLTTDTDEARAVGRNMIGKALGLINHVNTWRRLGFTEADLAKLGSDRLIDAMVAYGSVVEIAGRLNQHIEAGADHVAIRVLGGQDKLLPSLAALSDHLNPGIPRSTAVATWAH
jgi:probable F420-dependent oxidoreductase